MAATIIFLLIKAKCYYFNNIKQRFLKYVDRPFLRAHVFPQKYFLKPAKLER